MKISYNLKIEDLMAFYKRSLKKKSFIFKNYVFGVGVLLALLLSYYDRYSYLKTIPNESQLYAYTSNYWFNSAISLVLVIVSIFIIRMITISFLRIQSRNKTRLLGEKELEIINDRVIFSSQYSKQEYLFPVFQDIEEYRGYYFLYINKLSAIIVPKKTNGSDDFIKQLKEKANLNVIVC